MRAGGLLLVLAASTLSGACAEAPSTGAPLPASLAREAGPGVAAPPSTTSTPEPDRPAPEGRDAGAAESAPDAPASTDAGTTPDAATGHGPPPEGMLLVPAGPFTMGTDHGGEEDEHPAHTVTLPAFWLDRTEVTNAAYAICVAAKACGPRAAHLPTVLHHGRDEDFARPAEPVTGVTWDNAREYCAFRGARLPREAEFEKAARGTDDRRFPWGNELPTPQTTVFGRMGDAGAPDDVGTHPAGRGPYGHDDLGGNVWEWMQDEYDPVAYSRPGAPHGTPGSCDDIKKTLAELRAQHKQGFTGSNPIPTACEHVLRGGAYNYGMAGLRCTNRVHHPGTFRLLVAGFRCAKDA